MEALAALEGWRSLAGDWRFLGSALAVTLLATRVKRGRPLASALALPLGLLVFRKVALFIPVPGALSTEDRVTFWSTGAYWYFSLLFIVTAVLVAVFIAVPRSELFREEAFWQALFGGGVGHFVASGLFLPVDGWTHLSMPFVAHLAAPKVLLIQPWLPVLAGLVLALHVLLSVSGRGLAHREVNKLLLVVAVVAGLLQFGMQPGGLESARKSLSLAESWSLKDVEKDEVRNFLGVWAARTGSIHDCGVNLVEGASPARCPARETVDDLAPEISPGPTSGAILPAACVLILAVLIEWAWRRDRAPGPAAPGSAEAAVGSWRSIPEGLAVPEPSPRAARQALVIFAAIFTIALAAAIYWGHGLAWGATAAGLCGVWVTAELLLLPRTGFFDRQGAVWRFLCGRDQRGNRRPGWLVLQTLGSDPGALKRLAILPTERRLAVFAARGEMPRGAEVELSTRATWLTRVDLACADQGSAGSAAAISLPVDLWPRAVRKLLRSKQAEARCAGVRCRAVSSRKLLRTCIADDSETVRRVAWDRIKDTLTVEGAARLVGSKHEDVRAAAAASGKLPRGRLMRLAKAPSAVVRQAAWEPLLAVIRPDQAARLVRSKHPDVRCRVILAGKLARADVLSLAKEDPDPSVRDAAGRALGALSAREAIKLSCSTFADTRSRAVESGVLPRSLLKELCIDADAGIRSRAFKRVLHAITLSDAVWLSEASQADVRSRAVSTGLLRRERLRALLRFDPDVEVRHAAWSAYFADATGEEIGSLLASWSRREVRPLAARLPALSTRDRLEVCASDWQADVRRAAWESLQPPLSSADAAMFAASAYGDTRLRAIDTGLLGRERLVELCAVDCLLAVRCAAWERIASDLRPEEAEILGRSPFGEVRLNAVRSGLLPESRLIELRSDAESAVRAAARELLAMSSAGKRSR